MCILYECMNNIQVVFLAGSCCGCFSKVCQSELRWIGHRLLTCLSLKSTPLTLASWKKQAGQSGEKKEGQEGERRSQLYQDFYLFLSLQGWSIHRTKKKKGQRKEIWKRYEEIGSKSLPFHLTSSLCVQLTGYGLLFRPLSTLPVDVNCQLSTSRR